MHLPPNRQETLSLSKPACLKTETHTQLVRKKTPLHFAFCKAVREMLLTFVLTGIPAAQAGSLKRNASSVICTQSQTQRASHSQIFCPAAPLFSPVRELETIRYSHIAWELHFLKKDVRFSVRTNIQIYPKTDIEDFFKLDF